MTRNRTGVIELLVGTHGNPNAAKLVVDKLIKCAIKRSELLR